MAGEITIDAGFHHLDPHFISVWIWRYTKSKFFSLYINNVAVRACRGQCPARCLGRHQELTQKLALLHIIGNTDGDNGIDGDDDGGVDDSGNGDDDNQELTPEHRSHEDDGHDSDDNGYLDNKNGDNNLNE